jgi:hypothetical protein
MIYFTVIALVLSFLAFVSGCNPNFGGPPGLNILNNATSLEWKAARIPAPGVQIIASDFSDTEDFRVEFSGLSQLNNSYVIKCVRKILFSFCNSQTYSFFQAHQLS